MFSAVRSIWGTVEFVALWSGLSVGTIVGLAALFYFVPIARKFAIQVGVLVVVAWSCLMHGHIAGRADEASRLQILSDNDDKNAATNAAAGDRARAADIEAKAKAQHDEDLAEIARLGAGCPFDPDAGSLQPSGGDAPTGSAIGDKAKPAAVANRTVKAAGRAAAGQGLRFPLVWPRWLQGKEHGGDASPNGQ